MAKYESVQSMNANSTVRDDADMFSQCYFVHRHLQQCIVQATSYAN